MSFPVLLSVMNQSARVSDADVQAMVVAVSQQLAHDVAPVWGMVPALEFVPKGATGAGAPVTILDTPDVANALGYHDEDDSGVAYIKVFAAPSLDNGGTALTGPLAVSVTLSHEVIELVGDYPANRWADQADGSDLAFELCDPVEGDTYETPTGVEVSNFVLPEYFNPRAKPPSKYDFLGKLTAPCTMTPGGYLIHRVEPGAVTQEFGMRVDDLALSFGHDFPQWKRAAKLEKARRRRGPVRRAHIMKPSLSRGRRLAP